jgi:acetylornithine deacetylase
MQNIHSLGKMAISFLEKLIETPSFSKEEQDTADLFVSFFNSEGINYERRQNNVWVKNKHFDPKYPTILLNSHHDTVKPNTGYTRNPFEACHHEGRLYGLGSNDAGGPLVALLATFMFYFDKPNLLFNLLFLASAEEEISGKNGIECVLGELPCIDLAIVGEPTLMQMAVAEKGLVVLDCTTFGQAGHAARDEGENAIYKAMNDIAWFQSYTFENVSPTLGPIKMTVTQIDAGTQHNVVPDRCTFVVDVRATDAYSLEETIEIIKRHVGSRVEPRSVRLRPSGISMQHPIVLRGRAMGMRAYGSPTLSDQALLPFPSIKIGPGDSARSHTADEFIYVAEIEAAIAIYIALLDNLEI